MVGETIIELPFPAIVPPQLSEYQVHCALYPKLPPVNDSVEEEPEERSEGEELAEVGVDEIEPMVMVMLAQVVVLHIPCALT